MRDQRPKWAFWYRLLVGEEVDVALVQEGAVDQALIHYGLTFKVSRTSCDLS